MWKRQVSQGMVGKLVPNLRQRLQNPVATVLYLRITACIILLWWQVKQPASPFYHSYHSQKQVSGCLYFKFIFIVIMLSKAPMWKRSDSLRSSDSSIDSGSRPIKTFHLMFSDELGMKGAVQSKKDKILQVHHSGSIKQEQDFEGEQMVITEDAEYKQHEIQEVIQDISFDNLENGAVVNGHNKLKSLQKPSLSTNAENTGSLPPSTRELKKKVSAIYSIVQLLRDDVEGHRLFLKKAMGQWEGKALAAFKTMKENVDRYLYDFFEEVRRAKERMRDEEDWKNRCQVMQLEVDRLNRTLQKEKENVIAAKREITDRQDRLKKIERAHSQQRYTNNNDQTFVEDMRTKNKRLQYQLSQAKLQAQDHALKISKLKEAIRERQQYINTQNQQLVQLQKRLKEQKLASQDATGRQRRYQIQLKILRQRLQKQTNSSEKQVSRSKQQYSKLKSLLKSSEEQLVQCEEYINKLNNECKDLKLNNSKLHETIKDNEQLYYKKMQEYDRYLVQLENSIKQLNMSNEYKEQEYEHKQSELFRMRQEYERKFLEIRNKEYDIQEMKKEYLNKLSSLQLREQGMRAEYKMAIQSQNAVKDKWYQRYYMISPQRQRNMQEPIPQRDSSPYMSGRSSFTRKDMFEIPVREINKSPARLIKAKSDKIINLNTYRSETNISSPRNDINHSESQRGIVNLGSRINILRKELARELGQIGFNR